MAIMIHIVQMIKLLNYETLEYKGLKVMKTKYISHTDKEKLNKIISQFMKEHVVIRCVIESYFTRSGIKHIATITYIGYENEK